MSRKEKNFFEIEGPLYSRKVILDDFDKSEISLGRYPTCDIVLTSSEVSRHHAVITRMGNDYYIEDRGSSNGTFVNGELIDKKKLENGDIIKIGDFTLKFITEKSEVSLEDDFETNKNKTIAIPISQFTNVEGIPVSEKIEQQTQLRIINTIFESAKTLLNSDNLDIVLNNVMDMVFKFLNADRGFLMLYDEREKKLKPKIVKHREKPGKKISITFSKSIVNKVFDEGISILTEDAVSDQRFSQFESVIMQQIHSCMCVPLWINEKVIGIIYVDSVIFKNQFSEIDLYVLSIISMLAATAIEKFRLSYEIEREKIIRKRLERYFSPNLISNITSEKLEKLVIPEEKEISVIFCDIVKFTVLTNRVSPSEIAEILKTIFNSITDIVFEHEGTLDKYIGDAVMITFGAPIDQPDHADRAVKTAIEIQKAIQKINESNKFKHKFSLRIGINSGNAMCGNFGSDKRLDYTAIGDTVNLASRFESQVAQPGEIIIGEYTKSLLKQKYHLEQVGPVRVKGFEEELIAYKVLY